MSPIIKSQLEEIVNELSAKCYQTGTMIKIVSDPLIGVGMNPQTKELKISQWVLDELPESQIRYILGHEVSHLALKAYSDPKSLLIRSLVYLAAIIVIWSYLAFFLIDKTIWLFVVFPLIVVVVLMIVALMGLYIPIKDELNADLLTVTLIGKPQELLSTIESLFEKRKEKGKNIPKILSIKAKLLSPVGKLELKFRKKQLQELISQRNKEKQQVSTPPFNSIALTPYLSMYPSPNLDSVILETLNGACLLSIQEFDSFIRQLKNYLAFLVKNQRR